MGKKWTRSQRAEHKLGRYHRKREKVLTIVLIIVFVLAFLAVLFNGEVLFTPVKEYAVTFMVVVFFIFFFIGATMHKRLFLIFMILALLLLGLISLVTYDFVAGLAQIILIAVLIGLFIIFLAVAVFLTDLVMYEGW
ncbi:MAG: hypothetical protein KKA90_01600 [Nanoarchaeota archaeon]|nr:hypothetical protein [Nanoarchaeota archaeon]